VYDQQQTKDAQAGTASAAPQADETSDPRRAAALHRRAKQRKDGKDGGPDGKDAKDDKNKDKHDPATKTGDGDGDDLMAPDFSADGDKAKGKKDEKEKEKEKEATAPEIVAGATGILSGEATVKLGGKDSKLATGTVVEVVEAKKDKLKVKVFTGHNGAEAMIDTALFKAEPGVAKDEISGKEDDTHYEEFSGKLWDDAGPSVNDVAQGYIGDCYLMAAMGAVVASNPGAIKKLFNPQKAGLKSYQVTLHVRDDLGKLKPKTVSVDTNLPVVKDKKQEFAYANNGKDAKTAALWPALLEKAYALVSTEGTYGAIGGGGFSGEAMEAISGVESKDDTKPGKDQVIERFKKYQKEGQAVVCGTLGQQSTTKKKAFTDAKDGYEAKLTTAEGDAHCTVLPSTLKVTDTASKHHSTSHDDGKGKMSGDSLEKGSVDYDKAQVDLTFKKDLKPDKAENLEAQYSYRGLLDKDLGVWAHHAYIFEKIDGDKLVFKNPWGTWHPKPMSAEQWSKLFTGVSTNQVPKPDEKVPGG
jgi:Calpain family cysteine protease